MIFMKTLSDRRRKEEKEKGENSEKKNHSNFAGLLSRRAAAFTQSASDRGGDRPVWILHRGAEGL